MQPTMSLPLSASNVVPMRARSARAISTHAGFPPFYDEHYPQLVIAFQSALGDRRLAEDAAQEAMLRACQRWTKICDYDNPAGWCYRVGMNWATSRWRKRRREIVTDEPRTGRAGVVTDLPEDQLADDELSEAMARLSEDQRQVIVLRIWLDWSVRDTGEALGIAEGTVRSRQNRALKRLKTELEAMREIQ